MLTRPQQAEMAPVLRERVDFTTDDKAEPSMFKTALMAATRNWLSAPVGSGLTEGAQSSLEELESMSSSSLGFGLLVKGMAKRVGDIYPGENHEEFMKRAVETTTPIVNSFVSWKGGAQKRVQRFLSQQLPAAAEAPAFTAGTKMPASQSSIGVFDSAGNELVWDDDLDNYKPVLDTAFDAKVWGLVCNDTTSTASELHETITGAHQSSADFGGEEGDVATAQ